MTPDVGNGDRGGHGIVTSSDSDSDRAGGIVDMKLILWTVDAREDIYKTAAHQEGWIIGTYIWIYSHVCT